MDDNKYPEGSRPSHTMKTATEEDQRIQNGHTVHHPVMATQPSTLARGKSGHPFPPFATLPAQGLLFQSSDSARTSLDENASATTKVHSIAKSPPLKSVFYSDHALKRHRFLYDSPSLQNFFLQSPDVRHLRAIYDPLAGQLHPDPLFTMAAMDMVHKTSGSSIVTSAMANTAVGFDLLSTRLLPYSYRSDSYLTDRFQQRPHIQNTTVHPMFVKPTISVPSNAIPVANNAIRGTCFQTHSDPIGGGIMAPSDLKSPASASPTKKTVHHPQPWSPTQHNQNYLVSSGNDDGNRPSHLVLLPQDEITLAESSASKQVLPISMQLIAVEKNGDCRTPHYTKRKIARLATDEDVNWLSEYLCFARTDLLEVFQANPLLDTEYSNCTRNVVEGQIGLRCTYCAHIPHSKRETARSYSFPSSLANIYQNVAVMLHDHFGACKCIPNDVKDTIQSLKKKTAKGSANICRDYWRSSAKKLGLVDDSEESGIFLTSLTEIVEVTSGGKNDDKDKDKARVNEGNPLQPGPRSKPEVVMLVTNEDRFLTSDFYFALMTRLQLVHLTDSERVGIQNKKLSIGYAGIGCRYCYQKNRGGMCRRFPLSRRVLPNNVDYLYDHIRRCTLVPVEVKENLEYLKSFSHSIGTGVGNRVNSPRRSTSVSVGGKKKEFFDRIWNRMKDSSEDHQAT